MFNFKSRPKRRVLVFVGCSVVLAGLAHHFWTPGLEVNDGHDDKGHNALWLQHGWLGDDAWFKENHREARQAEFRSVDKITELASLCQSNSITDVFPHLTPTQSDGSIMAVDDDQVERLLDNTPHLRVMPWVGGRMGRDVVPTDAKRSARFVASIAALLKKHPRLAGVYLNIEPWPSGDAGMLQLLRQIKAALPQGKLLSISGYPPQVGFYPFKLAWSKDYYSHVAAHCDQIAPMFYDTTIQDAKFFEWSVARWTQTLLKWTGPNGPRIVPGVPTYAAAGPAFGPLYHNSRVETLEHSLAGIHRGLANFKTLPANYQGVAIYAEWETEPDEWALWRHEFAHFLSKKKKRIS